MVRMARKEIGTPQRGAASGLSNSNTCFSPQTQLGLASLPRSEVSIMRMVRSLARIARPAGIILDAVAVNRSRGDTKSRGLFRKPGARFLERAPKLILWPGQLH